MSESPISRDPGRQNFRPLDDAAPGAARPREPASFDPDALRPDPFGTGPKLPRRPAAQPMSTATTEPSEDFRRSAADELHLPPRASPPGGGGRFKVPIWAAAIGGLALAAVVFAAVTSRRDGASESSDEGAPAIEVIDRPRETELPPAPPVAPATIRSTDADAAARAYDDAAAVYRSEGLPGLVGRSQACFSELQGSPGYERLDYCLAFDAIGAALHQRLNDGVAPTVDSWFGRSQLRGVEAVRRVAPDDADPAARVLDVRRVLGEVGRLRRAAVPAAPPVVDEPVLAPGRPASPALRNVTPPERPPVPTPRPTQRTAPVPARTPPAATRTPPAAVTRSTPAPRPAARAPAPAASRAAPAPARPAVRPAPRPAPPPEVARRETTRSFSPSFDCRYARSRSEIAVCDDPRLSAADRALSRAYEGAIDRGADRRELRSEQDQWLRVRERAAPDPGAIEDAYGRRIRELESRNRGRRSNLDDWF